MDRDPRRLLGVCAALLTLCAAAAAAREGFYSLSEAENPGLSTAWSASGSIHFTWPSECSGFYVSRRYFLTGLHCVTNCRGEGDKPFASRSGGNAYQLIAPASPDAGGFRCAEASLGQADQAVTPVEARIVAYGSGAALPREDKLSGASAADLQELAAKSAQQSDWAIVEVSRPSDDFVCVRASELGPREPVWGIGYPAAAERTDHPSDGRREYVTRGRRSEDGTYGNAWLRQAGYDDAVLRRIDEFYGDRMYWVTSDAYMGMSGGGLFDADGNAVGVYAVLAADVAQAAQKYYAGSNGYLKMSHVLEEARARLGEERFREVFACVR